MDYKRLAKKAADAMLIKRKDNPGVAKARKRHENFIDRLLEKKAFDAEQFDKRERKIIKQLEKPAYGPLVYRTDSIYKVKTKIGENVRIAYSDADTRCAELARALREECWRRGCNVIFVSHRDTDYRKYYEISPEDSLAELPKVSELVAKNIDVRFFVGETDSPEWTKGLEKRIRISATLSEYLHDIYDKRKVRWCFLGFPVKMQSKYYTVPRKTYEKIFIETINETFSKRTVELCNYYEKAMRGCNTIKITASDGTSLTFSVKGRPLLVADGKIDEEDIKKGDVGLNIPDGEVFIAPLERSANGRILFEHVNIDGFGFVRNLWITFEKGRVIKYETDHKGMKIFRKFLDSNVGEKDRIAEFGIGTNPAARFVGSTLIDEKIFGSIHIAIGNNTGSYHGKNKASSHQDMIKIMKGKGGNVYVDGKLIMENGLPLKRI